MGLSKRIVQSSQLISLIVLIGLLAITLEVGLTQQGAFDDAYITYRYARNIAQGRGFVYNPGEAVLGTTTPLYTLLLAGLARVSPDIVFDSHLLSVLAWAMCVLVTYGLARNHAGDFTALLAAAIVATNALFLNVLGMETTVYILLALTTFYLLSRTRLEWAAVSAGLTFLCRWDGILVVAICLFAIFLKDRTRLLRTAAIAAAIMAPWLIYSQITFGSIFPNSFFAKAGQGWNQGLGGAEIGPFGRGLLTLAGSAYTVNPLFSVVLLCVVIGLISFVRRRPQWWTVVLWTVAYTSGYIILGVLQFGWYYPPLIPALALLAAYGVDALSDLPRLRPGRGGALKIVLMLTLSAACLIPGVDWLMKNRRFEMDAHSSTYVQVGQWLQAHTLATDSVGLLEIGIVGYYSDRTVIDTMGLVNPAMIGHLGDWLQTLQFAVSRFWPDYIVALKRTAWGAIVSEPWFKEAYELVAEIQNSADPVAPVGLYRRRDGFPPDHFSLSTAPDLRFDQSFVLRKFEVQDDHLLPGNTLQVQLSWEALTKVGVNYRFQFDLVNATTGQVWTLAHDLEPMHYGDPTTFWRAGDTIVDAYTLPLPASLSEGAYQLRLIATRQGEAASVFDSSERPVGYVAVGPVNIGGSSGPAPEPAYPVAGAFGGVISLKGYDFTYTVATRSMDVNLHWVATDHVPDDYTAFVHIISPQGEIVAQQDSPSNLPTGLWLSNIPVQDEHSIALPADLPDGLYAVRVGLYHWPDLQRLPVSAAGCWDASNDVLLVGYLAVGQAALPTQTGCIPIHILQK